MKYFHMKGRTKIRGTEQIRTAVGAFAELSLATRPRYQTELTVDVSDLILKNTKQQTSKLKFKERVRK